MVEDYINVYEQLLEKGPTVEFDVAEDFLNQGVFAVT
jgi:hypothetical protein